MAAPCSGERSRRRLTAGAVPVLLLAAILALFVTSLAQATPSAFTVSPSAKLSADRTTATITGTAQCDPADDDTFVVAFAQVFQVVGRVGASASSFSASIVPCTGQPEPFSIEVSTFFGAPLTPGRAGLGISGGAAFTFVALNTVVRLIP